MLKEATPLVNGQVSFSAEPSGNFYTVDIKGPKPESLEWDS